MTRRHVVPLDQISVCPPSRPTPGGGRTHCRAWCESSSIARARAFACRTGTCAFDEAWEIGCLVQGELSVDLTKVNDR